MDQRQKRNGLKDVDKRLGALRSDLDSMQKDMKSLAADAGDVANDRAQLAMRAAENVAERAFRLAEDTATHLADGVETWTNDNLDSARESIRTRPLSAFVLSMGVGALFAAIFLRR
jgi:ElaB/YqjD/DUF883 family membrane-anchored ribosome-binding protein